MSKQNRICVQQKQHQHHSRKSSNPKRAKVKATALSANTTTSEVANAEAANAETTDAEAVEGAGNNSGWCVQLTFVAVQYSA